MSDIQHYIGGKRVEGKSGRWGDVFNPATGEQVRRVAFAEPSEVDAAVKAAAAAFPGWAATPPLTRARIMFKFLELLAREHDALARTISEEHGKVFSDAQGEITRGVEVVVMLSFSVDRNGRVLAHEIARSSGHPELDKEVVSMIERAQPLPPFPPSMPEAKLALTVPIRFSLR